MEEWNSWCIFRMRFSNAQNARITRRGDRVRVIWLDPPERRLGGVSFLLFPAVWRIAWLDLEGKDDDGFLDGNYIRCAVIGMKRIRNIHKGWFTLIIKWEEVRRK